MPRIGALNNEYAQAIGADLLDKTPKTVLAAIVVSEQCERTGISKDQAGARLLAEWWALYWNGIVPQRPPGAEPQDETP